MIKNEAFANGTVIREPVGSGAGYWVGAPGAFFDARDGVWYLTYRMRRPRGVSPDRGGEVRIARSSDLRVWTDIVTIGKDQYASASIERSCLQRAPDGSWHYLTSFVHPDDGRWCTARLRAPSVEQLDPSRREVLFRGNVHGLEGVKDPWILEDDGTYHLFLSVATPVPATGDGSHATLDIFNTGECKSATALATSRDLERWDWQGVVLSPPASGWDKYCRRLNSVAAFATGTHGRRRYLGFYDGSASHHENYEERCALAASTNLRYWDIRSSDAPAFTSPHASGSIRYVDAKPGGDGRWYLFYEYARADGAHDLRLLTCPAEELDALLIAQ
jgi:hypothetical protein